MNYAVQQSRKQMLDKLIIGFLSWVMLPHKHECELEHFSQAERLQDQKIINTDEEFTGDAPQTDEAV